MFNIHLEIIGEEKLYILVIGPCVAWFYEKTNKIYVQIIIYINNYYNKISTNLLVT